MEFKNLLVDVKDTIATVTVNRPDKLNALNIQTMQELKEVFTKFKTDDSVNIIIITGAGEKGFVAGADISEINKLDAVSGKEFAESGQAVFKNIFKNIRNEKSNFLFFVVY